ncbi:MAG: PilC/PilY family type IV pilus protein [Acidovorax sp.]
MPRPVRFQKTLLASLMGAALAPQNSWAALDLADAPPGKVTPYVAPNVIISVDDSGSMDFRSDRENVTGTNETAPTNGVWPSSTKRINVLKYALKSVFQNTTPLSDGKIRLAWQVMHNNGNASGAASVDSGSMQTNSMRPLAGTHRGNFIAFVDSLKAKDGTPTHKMFKQADSYMRRDLSKNGPWAANPGVTEKPYLGCRRNYHIVMTDGRWNSYDNAYSAGGNVDNPRRATTLPDNNTTYGSSATTANFTKIYRDGDSDTLADWAFKSWSQSLQTSGLTGQASPSQEYDQAPLEETIGGVTLPKFWNPKYDPATWPHMVTFTIGFSAMATTWPGYPDIKRPTETVPFGYDGSFPDLVAGTLAWPDMDNENKRSLDLWHAALNGRGRYYAVEKGEDLEKAFAEIVKAIGTQNDEDRGSTATSGSNATLYEVNRFIASYVPLEGWRGMVSAETYLPDGTTRATTWGETSPSTATLLDARTDIASRVILTWSDKVVNADSGQTAGGVPFEWASDESNLSTAQKDILKESTATTTTANQAGQDRLNYIRGDKSKEPAGSPASYTDAKPLRQRVSIQGSIINSEVWYVGAPVSNYPLPGYADFIRKQKDRQAMIYVGGNDGMLHGFSATNGTEKLAYVPRGVLPTLPLLTKPAFNSSHKYSVDGSPMTGDVNTSPSSEPNWRTLLVGTLGAGGKGYFVLDVTDPGGFAATSAAAQNLVVMDKTRHASETAASVADCENPAVTAAAKKEACLAAADVGHIFAKPVLDDANPQRTTQITRLNNNRWAVVMGNGYNSKSERPVLLIQYLDGDRKLLRLVATGATATGAHANTTDNGLSAPRLVDINSDGRPDVAYAGDTKGNLWKFLIASDDDAQWGVAQWGANAAQTTNAATSGTPLYTARGGTEGDPATRTLAQPITAAPLVRANDRKKEVDAGGTTKTLPVGGMMVAFGTGRNITKAPNNGDPANTNKQTLYSVLDNTRYRLDGDKKDRVKVCASESDGACSKLLSSSDDQPQTVAFSQLVQRSIPTSAAHTRDGKSFWTVDATTQLDWATKKGWYMDLPDSRERLLKPLDFYDGSNLLSVLSQVPAQGSRLDPNVESCDAGTVGEERQYLTLINIMDGKRPSVQIMNTDGRNGYNLTADLGASRMSLPPGAITMIKRGGKMVVSGTKKDGTRVEEELALLPEMSMRPSWRQLK